MIIDAVVSSAWEAERSLTPCLRDEFAWRSRWASYACSASEPVYIDWTPPEDVAEPAVEHMAAFREPLFYSLTLYRDPPRPPEPRPRHRLSPWTLPVLAALWSGVMQTMGVWWCHSDDAHVVCVVERRALRYLPSTVAELTAAVVYRAGEKGLSAYKEVVL